MWLTDTHAGKALTHIRKKKDDEEGYGPGMTYGFFFFSYHGSAALGVLSSR